MTDEEKLEVTKYFPPLPFTMEECKFLSFLLTYGKGIDSNGEFPLAEIIGEAKKKLTTGEKLEDKVVSLLQEALGRGECTEIITKYLAVIMEAKKSLTMIISNYSPVTKVFFPVDSVNSKIWDNEKLTVGETYEEKKSFKIQTGDKKEKEIFVFLSLYLKDKVDSLPATLSLFDKSVMIACAATFLAGNEVTTPRNIYFVMGGESNPSSNDLDRIISSVDKLRVIEIEIHNFAEIDGGYERPKFYYRGSIVPSERTNTVTVNGGTTEDAIHFFRCPPLISFAMGRGQVEALPVSAMRSSQRGTTQNERLRDYILNRVCLAKSGKNRMRPKILYKTIYTECRINTRMQKSRAPEKIRKIMEDLKKNGAIDGYEMLEDGIRFSTKTREEKKTEKSSKA